MRLILIRHGQTPSNVESFLDTAVPGPGLTELGSRQAALVPEALAAEEIHAVYASSQTRAQQTAAPLAAARGQQLRVRPGLREIAAGALEMRNDMEAIMGYLTVVRKWLGGSLEERMPGADTGKEVLARFDAVVREAEQDFGGATVAMVSHGAMIRTWAGLRMVDPDWTHPERYELSNTAAVVLEGTMAELADGEPGRGWTCLQWSSAAIGGPAVTDAGAAGPAGETVPDATH